MTDPETLEQIAARLLQYPTNKQDILAALRQQREAGRAAWQPIASAPKDGTEILLTDGMYKRTGYWAKRIEAWSIDTVVSLNAPTHWAALPAAPGAEEQP